MTSASQGESRPDAPRTEKLRVLVVDDSAYNRQTLTAMIESDPGMSVVGRAIDGREALQAVFELEPDVITLDLEMPKMDGFAFLRLLMSRKPTPVIVISSHSTNSTVFRALELGAMDFMAKPGRQIGPELREIEGELIRKIRLVRRLQAVRLQRRAQSLARQRDARDTREVDTLPDPEDQETELALLLAEGSPALAKEPEPAAPAGIVGIAASTGGPPAVQQILCALPGELPLAILVAQHMPARFTRAFASRLDKMCSLAVVEARDGMALKPGFVFVAPGAANIEIEREGAGPGVVRVRAPDKGASAKITPSGDMLLASGARLFEQRFCAVVLTGMGADGSEGATLAREHGATVLAEDPHTAVMPGMPQSVIDAGVVDEVLPLDDMADAIKRFATRCTKAAAGLPGGPNAPPALGVNGRERGHT
ncbi:MAG: chemotaxis-specific protein-glutamate methyltransferase CheB [Myxococcales bacterium]|nr:chemotaxis-specific protein-glutamate methyltransferase CheB [Myxococcales bacterium]